MPIEPTVIFREELEGFRVMDLWNRAAADGLIALFGMLHPDDVRVEAGAKHALDDLQVAGVHVEVRVEAKLETIDRRLDVGVAVAAANEADGAQGVRELAHETRHGEQRRAATYFVRTNGTMTEMNPLLLP